MLAEEVIVACRFQKDFETVILFPVRISQFQGFSGTLSKYWLFAVLSQIGLFYEFFPYIVFLVYVKESV
jgi:hypothetical protein